MDNNNTPEISPTPGAFPGLGSILNVANNLSPVISYKGKDYELKELTLIQAARYSAFLKNRAKREAFREDDESVTPAMRQALLKSVMDSITIGDYEPGSPLYLASFANPYCTTEVFYILFHDEDESFTYDDAYNLVKERMKQVSKELQRQAELLKKSLAREASAPGRPA
jgi:hypothetical protein